MGWVTLFSRFAEFDDEGYILFSAINVFRGHALYDAVYSQYGPAFYFFTNGLQHVFGELTSNGVRVLALVLWVGPALLLARVVALTQGRWAACLTLVASFCFLHLTQDEPFHPGNLIVLLLALAVYVQAFSPRFAPWVLGALGSFIFLMKVNVGIFYFLGLFFWLTRGLVSLPLVLLRSLLLLVSLLVLTRPLLHETWVQLLDLSVFSGALNLMLTQRGSKPERAEMLRLVLAAALAFAAIITWALWQGSTLQGLFRGVILDALQHPVRYSFGVDFRPGTLLNLIVASAAAVLFRRGVLAGRGLVLAQGLLLAFVVLCIALVYHTRSIGVIFGYTAPWLWLSCVGPDDKLRSLCVWLLLFQYLHGFPIAGIQLVWGSFLIFTLLLLRPLDFSAFRPDLWWRTVRLGLVLLFAASLLGEAWYRTERYFRFRAIEAPGASLIRLEASQADTYSILQSLCVAHPGPVFTAPGLFSFNVWSGKPAPTLRNVTLWWVLLSAREQEDIRARLNDSLLICSTSYLDDLRQGLFPVSALHRSITEGLPELLRTGDFVVYGPRSLGPVPNTARLLRDGRRVSLRLNVPVPGEVTRIDICDYVLGPKLPYFTKRLGAPLTRDQTVEIGALTYFINSRTSIVSLYNSKDEFLGYVKVVE